MNLNNRPQNYCRQMLKFFDSAIQKAGVTHGGMQLIKHAIESEKDSQKFILPDGGRMLIDNEYRALDERESLRLPFKKIALEYMAFDRKTIMFAEEYDNDDCIYLMLVVEVPDVHRVWLPYDSVRIKKVDYFNRHVLSPSGAPSVHVQTYGSTEISSENKYQREIYTFLSFLNALQCSNVTTDSIKPSKLKQKKNALPFDTYHVLTLRHKAAGQQRETDENSDRRSPREHLRRGHIRRLGNGTRIWINAMTVNANKGLHSVSKDYRVERRSE